MLSGQGEAEKPGPLQKFLITGREYHRQFEPRLYDSTGLDPGYVWDGALRTATDEDSALKLREEHSWHEGEGLPSVLVSGDEARELEPALSKEVVAGLYLADDGNVNPRSLTRALGATARGAEILEYTRVTGFTTREGRVTGVRTTRGDFAAGVVVLAAGALSGLLSDQLGVKLPVFPMTGQLLVTEVRRPPIKANVWDSGNFFYVVPKRDGRVIVGATEEPGMFDRRPTLGGLNELSRSALALVPTLAEAEFVATWGGLRPATPSGYPLLGPLEEGDGLLLATGHHRNGLLLSAITGDILSRVILDEPTPVDISPFPHKNHSDVTQGE
jgi:glycine oxidase